MYSLKVRDRLLHDYAGAQDEETDILVASGDGFVTLATQLDTFVHQADVPGTVQTELERVVRTLMDLQRRYAIVKKQPNYRQ